MNWDTLIDETALATLLPAEHARFARPVKEALALFLGGLSAARQQEILAAQAALPPAAGVSERLGRLAQSCPVLHKLGQVLARERRLAPELRSQLQMLESLPPSVPPAAIASGLRDELGPLDKLGIELMPPALAEASVAVVIPFTNDGLPRPSKCRDSKATALECRRTVNAPGGVFKLLKPGIEQRMDEELAMLETVGAHLDQSCRQLDIPRLDYEQAFAQVRAKLQEEVHLDHEQRHLKQAAITYQDDRRVQIPALWKHCTPRVTAMERVHGSKITEHRLTDDREKRRLADLVVESLIAQPIFSAAEVAVFHGDPHAGNLFLADDGRLAILDWSLVGRLNQQQRAAVAQIILAAATLDARRICRVLEEFSVGRRPDAAALKAVVHAALNRVGRGQFPGLSWLLVMLDEAVQTAGLRASADLMLFRKTLYTLEGVVAEIGPDHFQIDEVLVREFLCHFTLEWPRRWVSLPHSREFATRLSNWDLTRTVLSLPWTTTQFWLHECLDAVRTFQTTAAVKQ